MSGHVQHNYDDPAAPRVCQNCGTRLRGPYCSDCGQHDVEYHRSFPNLAHELLENLFHFDGKFLVSVAWLLAKPGRLTVEFNSGRRTSQVPPLRFYIFVTVLFFLGVHLLNHGHLLPIDRHAANAAGRNILEYSPPADFTKMQRARWGALVGEAVEEREKANQSGLLPPEKLAEIAKQVRTEIPAAAPAPPRSRSPGVQISVDESDAGKEFKRRLKRGELNLGDFLDALEARVPTLLFMGMPVFALLLKLLYLRHKKYYIEHLIFSLHLHTWAFLALMIGSGYLRLAALGPRFLSVAVGIALVVWLFWYVLAAFRTVYAQGWGWTLFKAAVSSVVYFMALSWLLVGIAYLTVRYMVA